MEKHCLVCKEIFYVEPRYMSKMYCSNECRLIMKDKTFSIDHSRPRTDEFDNELFTNAWDCSSCLFEQRLCWLHSIMQSKGKTPPRFRPDLNLGRTIGRRIA